MRALPGAQPGARAGRKGKPRAAVFGCWKASSRANVGLLLDFTTAEHEF